MSIYSLQRRYAVSFITFEFIAVEAYVVLTLSLTLALLHGRRTPTRTTLTLYVGLVGLNRLFYLGALAYEPSFARWAWLTDGLFPVAAAALLAFAYRYGGDAFPRERRVVMVLSIVAAVVFGAEHIVGFLTGEPTYLFTDLLYVLEVDPTYSTGYWPLRLVLLSEFLWAAVVLLRKGWCPPTAWPAPSDRTRFIQGARALGAVVLAASFSPLLEALEYGRVVPVGTFSVTVLLLKVALVVIYAEHADQPTSLRFKLVFVSLAVVLAALTIAATPAFQQADTSALEARLSDARRVRSDLESGTLSEVPPSVGYVLFRTPDGEERLITSRGGITLEALRADQARSALEAEGFQPTGPEWAALDTVDTVQWHRGALAPPARQFDAVAFRYRDGALEVGTPHRLYRERLGEAGQAFVWLVLAFSAGIVLGVPVLFRGSLLRPVRQLREGLALVEAGDLTARVSSGVPDEIGGLAVSFNRMVQSLQSARLVAEEATKREQSDTAQVETLVDRARAAIQDSIADAEFDVTALAGALHLSRAHLSRRLREEGDVTPMRLIRAVRLDHARRLLAAGDSTVTEAAYASGFSSPPYFSRVFRDHFGEPPSALLARVSTTHSSVEVVD